MPEIQEDKVKIHHSLTKQQWVQDFKNLTHAQLGVLYYIKTSDPFGERGLEVTVTEMAKELGLDKSSVSRALKQLETRGAVNLDGSYGEFHFARISESTGGVNSRPLL